MCHDYEPKIKARRVTLVMQGGEEIRPVKVVDLKEVQTTQGPMFEAVVYASKSVLPANSPRVFRFVAVYTNFNDRQPKDNAPQT